MMRLQPSGYVGVRRVRKSSSGICLSRCAAAVLSMPLRASVPSSKPRRPHSSAWTQLQRTIRLYRPDWASQRSTAV